MLENVFEVIFDILIVENVMGKQAEEIVYQFCTILAPRTQNIFNMKDSQLRTDLIMLCNANDTEMEHNYGRNI